MIFSFRTSSVRQHLLAHLRDHGASLVEELPDGIHSCLRRGQRTGVFAYYRFEDRHFWRFWDYHGRYAVDNRFEIHEIIRSTPDEPRDEEWMPVESQEQALEAIAASILADLETQRSTALLGQQVDKVQRDLAAILKSGWNKPGVDKAAAQELYAVLRKPLPAPFVKQMRQINAEYGRTGDFAALLRSLDIMVQKYALEQAAASALVPASKPITRDDLELVCWMMVR